MTRTFQRFKQLVETFHRNSKEESYTSHALKRAWETLQYLPPGAPGAALADIGSMRGIYATAYVDIWHYERVFLIGTDAPINGKIVRKLPEGSEMEFPALRCNVELEPIPLPDAAVDTVVCMDVLEHLLFDPVYALNEMNRILRPAGYLLISVPNAASDSCLTFLVNDMQPGFLRHYISDPLLRPERTLDTVYNMGHYHEYTLSELSQALNATGFHIETVAGVDYGPKLLQSFRFRLLLFLVHLLFPRSPRVRSDEVVVLARKQSYTPLDALTNRFPAPLYRSLS